MANLGILKKQTPDYLSKGMGFQSNATATYRGQQNPYAGAQQEGKSVGGGIMSAAGMAASGASVGSMIPGMGTALGAGVGAVAGLASYMFS